MAKVIVGVVEIRLVTQLLDRYSFFHHGDLWPTKLQVEGDGGVGERLRSVDELGVAAHRYVLQGSLANFK